jgi:DNA-binding NtrC family response regulator
VTLDPPLPLVGPGVMMRALAARAEELRRDVSRPVLLVGARGLGKQFLAERIHRASALSAQPLLQLDARRAPEGTLRHLLDDAAPKSTLLIRHVDALSLPAQDMLDQRTQRRSAIVRLMATTTGDIVTRVTAGAFLEPLYYRLHAWPMLLPALADREREDLLALALAVLRQTGDADDALPTALADDAVARLTAHDRPDNLRELEATLALAQLRARGAAEIGARHLSLQTELASVPTPDASLDAIERWHILRALTRCNGNRTHAARSLGISRMTLIAKLKAVAEQGAP